VPAGLRAYEVALRPWVERIQSAAPGNGKVMTPGTRLGIALRRRAVQLMGVLSRGPVMTGEPSRGANGFPLPDYANFAAGRFDGGTPVSNLNPTTGESK
jgi:hypothetical protein